MFRRYLVFVVASFAAVSAMGQIARNVAKGADAMCSSPDNADVALLAVDGNEYSRWESAGGIDDVTFTVDLGKRYTDITEVQILWENAYAKTFEIQVSDDGESYSTAKKISGQEIDFEGGQRYLQKVALENVAGRYVRFQGIERGTAYGYSFWEFRVMSSMFDASDNIALGMPATAAINNDVAYRVNDGIYVGDRWGSSGDGKDDYANQWWAVDLGVVYNLREVHIFWEAAYAVVYVIEGRNTETDDWKVLASVSDDTNTKHSNAEDDVNVISLVGKQARYLRVRSTKNSLDNAYGMSMWELRVYANSVSTKLRRVVESLPLRVSGNVVTVSAKAGEGVVAYTMSGAVAASVAASGLGDEVSIVLPAGMYVVKSGDASAVVSLH